MRMIKDIKGQLRDTLVQKAGIVAILAADTVAAAVMGEIVLAGFGVAMAVIAVVAAGQKPHKAVCAGEASASLKAGDHPRAARLFALASFPPLAWVTAIAAWVAVVTGVATPWLGEAGEGGAAYLAYALPAMLTSITAGGAIAALRKSGRPGEMIASTWTLSIVNAVGNALSVYLELGPAGLAASWLVAEMVAIAIPVTRARRHGLLAVPTRGDVADVLKLSWPKYIAAIPAIASTLFRGSVLVAMAGPQMAVYTAVNQAYMLGDELSAQLAKVGSAALMRGDDPEDERLAARWALWARVATLPLVWWVGGLTGVALVAIGHIGLRAYIRMEVARAYRLQAKASGAEQVTRLALTGLVYVYTTPTAPLLIGVWVVGVAVYATIAYTGDLDEH